MKLARRIVLSVFVSAVVLQVPTPASAAGLSVTPMDGDTLTAQDLAQALVGPGVSVSNVQYTGANGASGTFSGGSGIVGFDEGIVLTSGSATNVVGPNDDDAKTTDNQQPGDADLDAIPAVGEGNSHDAAVLEFDFTPTASPIYFDYVFSSEEYNEYVNSQYNDVFAFFVTKPNEIEGSTTVNCAKVPGTETPVSVNTVNGGNPYGTNATNPEFFRNNDLSDGGGEIDTQMDGLTTVLNCQADVAVGSTNHLKLAIADTGDSVLDSAVFLKRNSLSPNHADLSITKTDGNPDAATGSSAGPDPVSSNGTVAYELVVENHGPDDASGVSVTDVPTGGTVVGASGSNWSCSFTSGQATCTRAALASGAVSDPITVVVQAPTTTSTATITDSAMVQANESDPDSSNNEDTDTTQVVGGTATENQGATFCTGQTTCTATTDTGTGATPDDPTVSQLTIPGNAGADPQTITLTETTSATFCGGAPCSGEVLTFTSSTPTTLQGVTDPQRPAVITMTFDKTVKGGSQVYIDKEDDALGPVLVPNCKKVGIARPHPCVSQRNILLPNGDRKFVILALEGDPTIGKR